MINDMQSVSEMYCQTLKIYFTIKIRKNHMNMNLEMFFFQIINTFYVQ
jgi:hypothetical protein